MALFWTAQQHPSGAWYAPLSNSGWPNTGHITNPKLDSIGSPSASGAPRKTAPGLTTDSLVTPCAFLYSNSFKNRTTCACPSRSASRKGVFPAALGGRSGSAPHSIKARTASSWPKLAAHPSGSLSYQSVIFAFASNRFVLTVSSRMRSHSPRIAARCTGHLCCHGS